MTSPSPARPYPRVDRPLMAATPVLVTGMPRSGTTWLARELARARRSGLPGREPMNPREGQFALGGTVSGWTQLDAADRPAGAPAASLLLRPRAARTTAATAPSSGLPLAVDPHDRQGPVRPALGPRDRAHHRGRSRRRLPPRRRRARELSADGLDRGRRAEMRRLQGRTDPPPADDVTAMTEFWTFLHERVLEWLPRVSVGGRRVPRRALARWRACGGEVTACAGAASNRGAARDGRAARAAPRATLPPASCTGSSARPTRWRGDGAPG